MQILRKMAPAAFLLAMASTHIEAAPIVIDTMPGPGDPTATETTYAFHQWQDLAAGFSVSTAGTVTHITAGIQAQPSIGGFIIGLASDELISNPATPSYLSPPPGSLWETRVCSTAQYGDLSGTGCTRDAGTNPTSPRVELGPNQLFDVSVNIFLPSAGIYWLYTRFDTDTTYASWIKNLSIDTDLVARRVGFVRTGDAFQADRTFFQTSQLEAAPGLRVVLDPAQVPEPSSWSLLALALAACGAVHGRSTCRRRLPAGEF